MRDYKLKIGEGYNLSHLLNSSFKKDSQEEKEVEKSSFEEKLCFNINDVKKFSIEENELEFTSYFLFRNDFNKKSFPYIDIFDVPAIRRQRASPFFSQDTSLNTKNYFSFQIVTSSDLQIVLFTPERTVISDRATRYYGKNKYYEWREALEKSINVSIPKTDRSLERNRDQYHSIALPLREKYLSQIWIQFNRL